MGGKKTIAAAALPGRPFDEMPPRRLQRDLGPDFAGDGVNGREDLGYSPRDGIETGKAQTVSGKRESVR